jgi:hypothetical protein
VLNPTEAFVEARKIVDNKIEGPRKKIVKNVPSMARVVAGDFGFLIFSHAF